MTEAIITLIFIAQLYCLLMAVSNLIKAERERHENDIQI